MNREQAADAADSAAAAAAATAAAHRADAGPPTRPPVKFSPLSPNNGVFQAPKIIKKVIFKKLEF